MDANRARAEAEETAGRWAEAADAWAEASAAATDAVAAAEAATRAADAYRRDDRPGLSARWIRTALGHRPATLRDAALLAGALLDSGEVEGALQVAAAACDAAEDDGARALGLDVLASAFLAAGRVPELRMVVDDLAEIDAGSARMSTAYRRAQLARLEGDLRGADAQWRSLVAVLLPHPAAAGALAGTWMDLGEQAVLRLALRGLPWTGPELDAAVLEAEADACFAQAGAAWARANRRAGLLRAECWRARLRPGGADGVLDTAVAYADEHGLVGMAIEVRCLRALARRRPLDALQAVELARQAPLVRGRARVIAAELGARVDLTTALRELAPDVPWRMRAERLAHQADA